MKNKIKNILINEDCLSHLKKLPDNIFDHCITDPPYNISNYENKKEIGWYKSNETWKKNEHNTFYSEVIVYTKELGIAGTIDLLVYNSEQNMYHLVDWKTNKRIDKNSFRNKKGILPSSQHLDDCNFTHYSLQLSFYRYILERYYGLEIGSQTLFHLKEDDSYEIYNVEYQSEDLINMLREKDLI